MRGLLLSQQPDLLCMGLASRAWRFKVYEVHGWGYGLQVIRLSHESSIFNSKDSVSRVPFENSTEHKQVQPLHEMGSKNSPFNLQDVLIPSHTTNWDR